MTLDNINRGGGIVGSLSLRRLFSDLDIIPHLGFIHVPALWFIIFLLGGIVFFNKRLIFLFLMSFLLFSISLGGVAPFHGFLYKHIFFIRYFRNIHFFIWFAIPVFILFLSGQLKSFMSTKPESLRGKILLFVWITVVHGSLALFIFWKLDHVIQSTFWTIGLSYLFFVVYFFQIFKKRKAFLIFTFLAIACLQPMEVFTTIVHSSRKATLRYSLSPYSKKESIPRFKFQRPCKGEKIERKQTEHFGDVFDASGFLDRESNYLGLKWSYFILNNVNHDILKDYVKNKFILYDVVKYMSDKNINIKEFEEFLKAKSNVAVISEGSRGTMLGGRQKDYSEQSEVITGNNENFHVMEFDINSLKIKTNFRQRKFLVYNDSFHQDWFAYLNGKRATLYKANIAFKGVWLPAGENILYLKYRSAGRYYFTFFLLFIFYAYFLYLLFSGIKLGLFRIKSFDKKIKES